MESDADTARGSRETAVAARTQRHLGKSEREAEKLHGKWEQTEELHAQARLPARDPCFVLFIATQPCAVWPIVNESIARRD